MSPALRRGSSPKRDADDDTDDDDDVTLPLPENALVAPPSNDLEGKPKNILQGRGFDPGWGQYLINHW